MLRLAGKSALVIGAYSGIGQAVCEAFSREGAAIALADKRDPEIGAHLAQQLSASGTQAVSLICDVLAERQVISAVEKTIGTFGKLDILVNNAGVGMGAQPLHKSQWDEWQTIIDVNVRSVMFGIKAALPHMLARGYGRIINTASQLAHKPAPLQSAYCASKAAVVALTASVSQEVAGNGVTVNCVCPGPTDTAMWRSSDSEWIRWKLSQLPIGRVGQPDEIASAYVYLASDDASYMIGQSISPNGGDVFW